MLALKSTLNSYVTQKQNIISNPGAYTKSVSVPHHNVITSSQVINSTINIPTTETSAWWAGRGSNGDRVLGLNNIHGGMPIFDGGMFEQVRQKIIAITGENNIEVPQQGIMLFGPHIIYQLNASGQGGSGQGGWQHGGEPNNGSIRFFYKLNKEQTRTETTYTTRQEHDSNQYQQAINNTQKLIDSAMQNIANLEQQEAIAAKQKQEALIKQQQAEALKAQQEIEKQQLEITAKLSAMSNQERSELLSDIAGKTDVNSLFTSDEIKKLGFDAALLSFLAIQNNQDGLLEIGMESGLDNGGIARIAITKNDLGILEKLASDSPTLLHAKQGGLTLLQIAITGNASLAIVSKLIELDKDSVSILSDSGESALKLAIGSGDAEIIKLVSENADLTKELEQLHEVSHELKMAILESLDHNALIQLLSGEAITYSEYFLNNILQNDSALNEGLADEHNVSKLAGDGTPPLE